MFTNWAKHLKKYIYIYLLFIQIVKPLMAMDAPEKDIDKLFTLLEKLNPPRKPAKSSNKTEQIMEKLKTQFAKEINAQPLTVQNLVHIEKLFLGLANAFIKKPEDQTIINHLRLCNASLLVENANLKLALMLNKGIAYQFFHQPPAMRVLPNQYAEIENDKLRLQIRNLEKEIKTLNSQLAESKQKSQQESQFVENFFSNCPNTES